MFMCQSITSVNCLMLNARDHLVCHHLEIQNGCHGKKIKSIAYGKKPMTEKSCDYDIKNKMTTKSTSLQLCLND